MLNYKRCFRNMKATNLYSSLKILKIITILNGLLPFQMGKDGKTIRPRKLLYLIAMLHYGFFIFCSIITVEENQKIRETFFRSDVSDFVAYTFRIVTILVFSSISIISLFLRNHQLKIIESFINIDEIFKHLSIKPKYQEILNLTIYMSIALLSFKIFFSVACQILFRAATPSFPMQVVFNLPYTFMWIYILIYVTYAFIVKFCFREINRVRL